MYNSAAVLIGKHHDADAQIRQVNVRRLNLKRLFLLALTLSNCFIPAWAHADIFSDSSLVQAKQRAAQEHKLLLVDFTASWCPPCRRMESATWGDGTVQEWISKNAVAVQVDVDKDADTAASLKVEAMPTLVIFKPEDTSKEFARQVGFMDADEVLDWLKGANSGKSADKIRNVTQLDENSLWEHISKARQLSSSRDYEAATAEYVWLWNNLPVEHPTFGELRCKAEPVEMNQLCKVYPQAKSKFAELRDTAEKAGKREDWLVLNGVLDEYSRSLEWFDKVKKDPAQRGEILKCGPYLERVIFANCRWSDAATYLYPDPIARIQEFHKQAEKMKHPGASTEVAPGFDPMPSMVLMVYGAYVGAGRDDEAKKIYDECIRLDDTEAMRQALGNMGKSILGARQSQR